MTTNNQNIGNNLGINKRNQPVCVSFNDNNEICLSFDKTVEQNIQTNQQLINLQQQYQDQLRNLGGSITNQDLEQIDIDLQRLIDLANLIRPLLYQQTQTICLRIPPPPIPLSLDQPRTDVDVSLLVAQFPTRSAAATSTSL